MTREEELKGLLLAWNMASAAANRVPYDESDLLDELAEGDATAERVLLEGYRQAIGVFDARVKLIPDFLRIGEVELLLKLAREATDMIPADFGSMLIPALLKAGYPNSARSVIGSLIKPASFRGLKGLCQIAGDTGERADILRARTHAKVRRAAQRNAIEAIQELLLLWEYVQDPEDLEAARRMAKEMVGQDRADAFHVIARRTALAEDFISAIHFLCDTDAASARQTASEIVRTIVQMRFVELAGYRDVVGLSTETAQAVYVELKAILPNTAKALKCALTKQRNNFEKGKK